MTLKRKRIIVAHGLNMKIKTRGWENPEWNIK